MQIFSKLQRNSTYYFFVIILIFFAVLINSSSIFFPVLLGSVILCLDLFSAFLYIGLFSLLHNYNVFYFELFYLFFYFYLKNKILDFFDKEYFDVILVLVIYFAYFVYLLKYTDINFCFIYILYNYAFDLIIIRIFKCKPE